jgi:hypothetical protein
MKIPLFRHHLTNKEDALLTATVLSIALVAIRFFVDGMTFTLFGHVLSFTHVDSASYAALLSPIAGAHGVKEFCGRGLGVADNSEVPDDPDAC